MCRLVVAHGNGDDRNKTRTRWCRVFSYAVNAAASPRLLHTSHSSFYNAALQTHGSNPLNLKDSKIVEQTCVVLSHWFLSDRSLINLPKGVSCCNPISSTRRQCAWWGCEMLLLVTPACQFMQGSHQSVTNRCVIISVCPRINCFYRGVGLAPSLSFESPSNFLSPNWIIQSRIQPLFDIWDLSPTWAFWATSAARYPRSAWRWIQISLFAFVAAPVLIL